MRNLSEEIINKYLTGQCSEEELIEVNAWISESDENARQLFRMEEIYHLGNSTIMPMNREWLMRKKGFINNCRKRKRRKIKYCICIAG
jgi:transmembrane sensor